MMALLGESISRMPGHRNISTDTGQLRTILVVVLPTKNSRIWEWPYAPMTSKINACRFHFFGNYRRGTAREQHRANDVTGAGELLAGLVQSGFVRSIGPAHHDEMTFETTEQRGGDDMRHGFARAGAVVERDEKALDGVETSFRHEHRANAGADQVFQMPAHLAGRKDGVVAAFADNDEFGTRFEFRERFHHRAVPLGQGDVRHAGGGELLAGVLRECLCP